MIKCVNKDVYTSLFIVIIYDIKNSQCLWRNFSLGKILNGDLVKLCSHLKNVINSYLLMTKI